MLFRYKAIDPDGRKVTGVLEAVTQREVFQKLNEKGRLPISATPADERSAGGKAVQRGLTARALPGFFRRLAQMTKAGVPAAAALGAMARTDGAGAAQKLNNSVRRGASLADALEAYGAPFEAYQAALVRAGERGGGLGEALDRMATQLERLARTRAAIISMLIYPALLSVVSIAVFGLLMTFVTPRFEALFADANAELPLATRLTIDLAGFVRASWWLGPALFLAMVAAWRRWRDHGLRHWLDEQLIKAPMIGRSIASGQTARFIRTLGALIDGGVPVTEALSDAQNTVANSAMRRQLDETLQKITRGARLSTAFSEEDIGDGELIEILRVGEATGKLGPALLQAADIYDAELERRLKLMANLAEPLIILTLGLLIGAVVVSLFVGVLSINDLAY